jgi:aspartyl-tRNA(Asn)/glutamyl-tRNA(Gln) amidotransferase subunit A
MELPFLTIAEASKLIATGALTASALTEAYLERIEALDPVLNSYITVTADLARQQAHEADAEIINGRYRGPLHGIPFGLKDMFDTAGVLTTAHSKILAGNVPRQDAAVVSRLRQAGAVLLGKQACHEFAHGGPSMDLPWPPARNPWNPRCYPGGSSNGSAVAVAAGLAAASLGTDTGGSVRTPAYLCGIVGFKPTFGLVSRRGMIPFSQSCDHVGPMTRSVEDCALLLQAIAGHDTLDRSSATVAIPDYRRALSSGVKGLRIGVIRHFWEEDRPSNPELCAAVDAAIEVLSELGAIVEEVRLRPLMDYYRIRIVLTESEQFAQHAPLLRHRAGDYGEHFLSRTLPAVLLSAHDYIAAQRARQGVIDEMRAVHARYDLFLTAGAGPAPDLDAHQTIGVADKWMTPNVGSLFTLTGAPAMALPCGFSSRGMPLGLQLAGRPFEDATVLAAGHAYEKATRWGRRRPESVAGPPPSQPRRASQPLQGTPPDDAIRNLAIQAVRAAGLDLTPKQFEFLLASAPYALDFARQVRLADNAEGTAASTFSVAPHGPPASSWPAHEQEFNG